MGERLDSGRASEVRLSMTTAGGATQTRRGELLAIAADQFAAFGFHNVTVDDLGRAAGVSGPALYHHFASKEALLGEMLVSISQQLLDGGRALVQSGPTGLLDSLILFHCQFAVDNSSLITVHFRDLVHATDVDQRRVRRLQASYASLWIQTVVASHPNVDERRVRAAVHVAFGLMNSTPFSSTLPRGPMIHLLSAMATGALGQLELT